MAPNVRVPPFTTAPQTVVGGTPTTEFSFDFPFWNTADIIVMVDDETLDASEYSVEGLFEQLNDDDEREAVEGGFGAGIVTLDTAVSDVTVTIDRLVEGSRETVFSKSSPLPMSGLNADINRLTARQQDLARILSRTLVVPAGGVIPTGQDIIDAAQAVAGRALTTGANTTSAFVGNLIYQRVEAGSVPLSVFDKLTETVSVLEFGAVADGVTDDSAAIEAAIAALPNGGNLVLPHHGTNDYGVIDVTVDKPIRFIMPAGVQFVALNATGDVFKFTSFGIRGTFNMSAKSGVVRTAGAYVKATVAYLHLDDGEVRDHYIGFELDGATLSTLENINFRNATRHSVSPGGAHVVVGRNTLTVALLLQNLTSDTDYSTGPLQPDAQCLSGIRVFNSDALIISKCDIVRSGYGLHRTPGNGQAVTASYVHHSFFDNGRGGIKDQPTGTGQIFRNYHDTIWASSSTNAGVDHTATAGNIFGQYYLNLQSHLNGTDGAAQTSGVVDINYTLMAAGANVGAGVSIAGDGVRVRDSFLGAYDGLTGNLYAVFVASGSTDYQIKDNGVEGNTSLAISDGAMHSGRDVRGNRGFPTKAYGTATMATGATTATVSTGLPYAVPLGLITVTRPLSLGAASRFGVQNSVAGAFDIVFDVAPGSAISLPWSASLETM